MFRQRLSPFNKPCCVSLWICFWFASMHHVPRWNGFSPYEKLPEKCLPRQNHAASSNCSFWQSKNKRQQSTTTGCKTLTTGMVNGKLSSCCTLAFLRMSECCILSDFPSGDNGAAFTSGRVNANNNCLTNGKGGTGEKNFRWELEL